MDITIEPGEHLQGQISVPGDKSISHRALILSSLVEGPVEIEGLLEARDTLATLNCLQKLGVEFQGDNKALKVKGVGIRGYREPDNVLNAENSATTARLLLGMLSGQPFFSTLTGDDSLRNRPMGRGCGPLKQMGAFIDGRGKGEYLPLYIRGCDLMPIHYQLPVASPQLKSALLLAALFTRGVSEIIESVPARDHTERMLAYMGGRLVKQEKKITLLAPFALKAERLQIPGDVSSASFFLVAAALHPHGELLINEVGINPTRTGIIDVLKKMGAAVKILNIRNCNGEPVADLYIQGGSSLKGIEIDEEMIPRLIDEIPVIAVAALFAEGETVIKGAAELRLKETDRLRVLTVELKKMGAVIEELPDGLVIKGKARLSGARCSSHGDHRIAMALAVAALSAGSETVIQEAEAVDISFPGFFELLQRITAVKLSAG